MAEKSAEVVESTADREIVLTRLFDAPRRMVWEAWADPKQIVLWFGPKGFTTTIEEMDLWTGGVWKQVMHGPDGTDYPCESVFTEVVPHERLGYRLSGGKRGGLAVQFESMVTFADEGGKTRLTLRMVFPSAEARDQNVREYRSIEGGEQTLQRLAEHLETCFAASAKGGVR
ncbi:MAG: SRPBCC family protein [Edaphobacter sp.]